MDEQEQILKDAFERLPAVLREAITDADIQAQLRKLSEKYKLHLDKWDVLENEIMLALLGLSEPDKLADNIVKEVGLTPEDAQNITQDVATIVFDPIQERLRAEVGESQSVLEKVDTTATPKPNQPIDLSKFTASPVNPQAYQPQTEKKYSGDDPYHEAVA